MAFLIFFLVKVGTHAHFRMGGFFWPKMGLKMGKNKKSNEQILADLVNLTERKTDIVKVIGGERWLSPF